ncbi:hypothetical protein [Massilia brevitalea]|uniref:hypothetical protein n=1 Tax=Massilia brevitalea TaxID=442526 RepID=UPI002739CC8E|nr:hypothetical protein [Massilia brevitalea]
MLERLRRLSRNRTRLHARIANVRNNGLCQLSTSLNRQFHTIGIEDLQVKGILRNRCLARCMPWLEQSTLTLSLGAIHVADDAGGA